MIEISSAAAQDSASILDAFGQGDRHSLDCVLDGQTYQLTGVYRYLPGQRLTGLALTDSGSVVLKWFYGQGAGQAYVKERNGLSQLREAGIPTATCLLDVADAAASVWVLGLQYLDNSLTLKQALQSADSEDRQRDLLHQAVDLFIRLHQARLLQPDPHLDNFLLYQSRLHMIDAGLIQTVDAGLGAEQGLENLALFFAQLSPDLDELGAEMLGPYLEAFGLPGQAEIQPGWDALILKQRRWRERRFVEKKAFRRCTAFDTHQSSGWFRVWDRALATETVHAILADPIGAFEKASDAAGLSSSARVIQTAGQTYRIDAYQPESLRARFGWSPAARAWQNAQRLRLLGIPALTAVGAAEQRLGRYRGTSFLLSAWQAVQPIPHVWSAESTDAAIRAEWLRQIEGVLQMLQRCALLHGHLTPDALLIERDRCVLGQLQHLRHQDNSAGDHALQAAEQDALRAELNRLG